MDVMDNVVTIHFEKPFELDKGVTVEFIPAGHILGAASIKVTVSEKGMTKTIGFTGDLGKSDAKVVVAPKPMTGLDYLVMEATYGARLHIEERSAEDTLVSYIKSTMH